VKRSILLITGCLLWAATASASIQFERGKTGTSHQLLASNEPLDEVAARITRETGMRIVVRGLGDQRVSMRIHARTLPELVRYVAAAARRSYTIANGVATIGKFAEPRVDMDVKDGDVLEVFETLRQQCGIRNLLIDPGVAGKATFLFDSVPCDAAFRAVLQTFALDSVTEGDALVGVRTRQ
jgi:hypothetical protein